MCIPMRRNSAASIVRSSRSMPRRRRSPRRSKGCSRRTKSAWRAETDVAHADYLAWTEKPTAVPGAVNLGEIMVWLRENLQARRSLLTNGAGNFSDLAASLLSLARLRDPARPDLRLDGLRRAGRGRRSKRLYPERTVFALAGDGDFLMNGQEFATAVQYDLPIIVIVCDNGMYGTIRMHQEREYPGRVSATTLKNPDFAAYARAFGGFGVTVEKTADFPRPSRRRRHPASPRSSTSRSIPKRSRRRRRSRSCASRGWRRNRCHSGTPKGRARNCTTG